MKAAKHCLGGRVACAVARSITDKPNEWKVGGLPTRELIGARLESSRFTVVLIPNERCPCLRIFDNVKLIGPEGGEVSITLLGRLCIRRAARRLIQQRAWLAL